MIRRCALALAVLLACLLTAVCARYRADVPVTVAPNGATFRNTSEEAMTFIVTLEPGTELFVRRIQ